MAIQIPAGHQGEKIAHPGEEWVYVLAGRLQLITDGTPIDLKAGDTCHFRGDTVRSYVNPGRDAATVLWVGTVPVFRRLAVASGILTREE